MAVSLTTTSFLWNNIFYSIFKRVFYARDSFFNFFFGVQVGVHEHRHSTIKHSQSTPLNILPCYRQNYFAFFHFYSCNSNGTLENPARMLEIDQSGLCRIIFGCGLECMVAPVMFVKAKIRLDTLTFSLM